MTAPTKHTGRGLILLLPTQPLQLTGNPKGAVHFYSAVGTQCVAVA